ncbi:unnamed protein product [Sphagnum balticum]
MCQQARMTSRGVAECGTTPIYMPSKAKTPWQPAHGLEYVLEVVSTAGNDNIAVNERFKIDLLQTNGGGIYKLS